MVRVAQPDEAQAVSDVLLEAADWLERRGIPLWTRSELSPEAITPEVTVGDYILALDCERPVGAARLTREDPLFWPDAVQGDALYLHRLAVRRSHSGGRVSGALIAWAAASCAALHRPFLRLDCVAARTRLRGFYESRGFSFHSQRTVGPYTVARYQLAVLPLT